MKNKTLNNLVCKRIAELHETFSVVVFSSGAAIFLCVHHSAATGLCFITWQRGIVFSAGYCYVLFKKSTMVKFKIKKNEKRLNDKK